MSILLFRSSNILHQLKKKKKTADPFVKITVALREKACYNNAETFVHEKSITQSQEDNGYGIY